MVVEQHAPGTFCWAELATSEEEGARRFYGALLGWEFQQFPMGEGAFYTMCRKNGRDVCGLYRNDQEGVPPHWASYVSVDDADAISARAAELGGKVVMPSFDVYDFGRMAVLQDPTGADFCLWQPKGHQGFGVVHEHGAPCWFELDTRDVPAAIGFYSGLFGWTHRTESNGYVVFQQGDHQVGGCMQIGPERGAAPPNWLVHFAVDDVDAACARAQATGGRIMGPMDIPGVGRFAVLQDPQGAWSVLIRFAMPAG